MNYQRVYDQIVTRAKVRGELGGYSEVHHITPKCLGGSDDEHNLVNLTPREHFICHHLLHRIHPHNSKLAWAFVMMCNVSNKNQYRYTPSSRIVEEARLCIVDLNRELGVRKRGNTYPNISAVKMGHIVSNDTKMKMKKAHMNMSEESRDNIRSSHEEFRSGIWVNDGTISKRSRSGENVPNGFVMGRLYSPSIEQRKKQSKKMKGKMVGYKNPSAKRVGQYDKDGRLIRTFDTIKEAELETNIKKIGLICNNRKKPHNTYDFRFI